jgi:hypothetical protein
LALAPLYPALPDGPVRALVRDQIRSGALTGFGDADPTGQNNRLPQMTATSTDDGSAYLLHGEKLYTANGSVADLLGVSAATDGQVCVCFLDTTSTGFSVESTIEFIGSKGLPSGALRGHATSSQAQRRPSPAERLRPDPADGFCHQQAGKSFAYVQLNKIVNDLARKATWAQLNKNGVTQIVKAFYERLASQLTKQKLGQAVPVVGIMIGAGLNARLLSNLTSDAQHLYRKRFLREKHSLKTVDVTVTTKGGDLDLVDDTVHIAEIVEEDR